MRSILLAIVFLPAVAFAAPRDLIRPPWTPMNNIVLYVDADGNPYTFNATTDGQRTVLSSKRSVLIDEIIQIEDMGFKIIYFDDDSRGAAQAGNTQKITQRPSLPSNFTIMQLNGVVYGNFYVPGTRPAGKNTQWVGYTYYSSLMGSFGSHIAVSLLSDTSQLTGNYPPTNAPAIVGNGVIIGNVAGTPNGCGFGGNPTPVYNMEVESYWNGGNKLYPNTCAPSGLADVTYYQVAINANVQGYVAYTLNGGASWVSPSPYTIPDRPAGLPGSLNGGGLIFGMVPTPDPDYTSAQFGNAGTGWF